MFWRSTTLVRDVRVSLPAIGKRQSSAVNIFALGAGLPTPPGSDRDCRGNAMGETCGRAFRRGRETPPSPMSLPAMRCNVREDMRQFNTLCSPRMFTALNGKAPRTRLPDPHEFASWVNQTSLMN